MTVVITEKEKSRIKYKSSDGTCTVIVDEKEYEGLIVGMSTNGTYTIQTLDENSTIPDSEKKKQRSDQVQQVEEDFVR